MLKMPLLLKVIHSLARLDILDWSFLKILSRTITTDMLIPLRKTPIPSVLQIVKFLDRTLLRVVLLLIPLKVSLVIRFLLKTILTKILET